MHLWSRNRRRFIEESHRCHSQLTKRVRCQVSYIWCPLCHILTVASRNRHNAIERLDAQISSLTRASETVQNSLGRRIIHLRRERNVLAPVHKLPPELFALILEFHLDTTERQTRYLRLHALSMVCSSWKATIEDTPILWSVIQSEDSSAVVTRALQRSKNHPLKVYYNSILNGMRGLLSAEEFAAKVGDHLRRWSYARIIANRDIAALEEVLQSPAPLLEHLNLSGLCSVTPGLLSLDLLHGRAKKLGRLSIYGVSIRNWDTALFSRLHTLVISALGNPQPSSQQLLAMLHASPLLEHLTIRDLSPEVGGPAVPSTPRTRLEYLRQLRLCGLMDGIFATLVSHIDVPQCEEVDLGCSLRSGIPFTLGDPLAHFIPILTDRFFSEGDLTLAIGETMFCITKQRTPHWYSSELDLDLRHVDPVEPLKWFVQAFGSSLPSLSITLALLFDFDCDTPDVTDILKKLPGIVAIRVENTARMTTMLLFLLSLPFVDQTSSPPTKVWPFAQLRTLRLNVPVPSDLAIHVFRRRYGHGDGGEAGGDPPAPQPLELVIFTGPKEGFEELEAIMGEGRIEFLEPDFAELEEEEEDDDNTDNNSVGSQDIW